MHFLAITRTQWWVDAWCEVCASFFMLVDPPWWHWSRYSLSLGTWSGVVQIGILSVPRLLTSWIRDVNCQYWPLSASLWLFSGLHSVQPGSFIYVMLMLLFAVGLGLSQSRFPPRDSWIPGWSPLVCSIGMTVSMSSDEPDKRRNAWHHVACCCSWHRRWGYRPSLLCSYRSLVVYNIRPFWVSLVVIEWQTFNGSIHLAKYCADSSSKCSITFSISASTCRWSTLDILWQPLAIHRVYIICFCRLCRVGLYTKQVQHIDDLSPHCLVSHQ